MKNEVYSSEVGREIDEIRSKWGRRLLILGHHYQRSSVLRHADEIGDSLELSRRAAAHTEAEKIVFLGVRFMAESADILTSPSQVVYMPETRAGCPMADMIAGAQMQEALDKLAQTGDWVPVAYVNSSAEVKACCGRAGGSTCTSSNAAKVFQWALDAGKRIFFVPDEHLGVNTAHDLGISDSEVRVCGSRKRGEKTIPDDTSNLKVLCWKGFCLVHTAFKVEQVRMVRERYPEARIIIHPEAPREVVDLCDEHGSTAQIIRYVDGCPEGSTVVIGTEVNLVDRLAEKHRGRLTIKALSPSVCANMAKCNEINLLNLLRKWPVENEIHVDRSTVEYARKALSVMLEL